MYNYRGPKLKLNDKPFSRNLDAKGGFVKAELFKCTDGDTAVFKIDGVREIVRLLVVNTPELGDNPEMFAVEARDYLEYVLSHAESIYLQTDKNSDFRDSTERRRLLCWLWVDNELVNYNLVRLGYAKVKYIQSEKLRYLKNLRYAERLAKEDNLRIHSISRK